MQKAKKWKEWFTLEEAARYLSIVFGDDTMSASDVLQLVLDEKLTLSVRFLHRDIGKVGRYVPYVHAKKKLVRLGSNGFVVSVLTDFVGYDELPPGFEDKVKSGELAIVVDNEFHNGPYRPSELEPDFIPDNCAVLQFSDQVVELQGVFDVPMIGSARLEVENTRESLSGKKSGAFFLGVRGCPIVRSTDEDGNFCYYKLQVHVSDVVDPEDVPHRDWDHPDNFASSSWNLFPPTQHWVIRASALSSLEQALLEPTLQVADSASDKSVSTKRKNTYLTIIEAMAKSLKIDTNNTGQAAARIANLTDQLGAELNEKTISNILKEIPAAIEARMR